MSSPQPLDDALPWVDDRNVALLTDLYELTMLRAYARERMFGEAVFSLFVRKLPPGRNYLLACGLDAALRFLERVRFGERALAYLATLSGFSAEFLDWLREFRFTGDVYAVPEGTPVFAGEPLLEVVAPLPQAQFAETFLMNQVHFQTLAASKAARVVTAAAGRPVVDFGMRRMHGADAALAAARAFHVAGVAATSNVLAGEVYGVPLSGTMAHSYIQAHAHELAAFRSFARVYPEATLLVDTYDTLEGVRRVIALARELGPEFRVRAVRLDSGDLRELSIATRKLLDDAGLRDVRVFASGGLDEHAIAALIASNAPIDGFGVGTAMGVSADAPALDIAYKLTEYEGRGRLKRSTGKRVLPGRKQVYRLERDGRASGDVIARAGERHEGRPLLRKVMQNGRRLPDADEPLDRIRARARAEIAALPEQVQALAPCEPGYPVAISEALLRYEREVAEQVVT